MLLIRRGPQDQYAAFETMFDRRDRVMPPIQRVGSWHIRADHWYVGCIGRWRLGRRRFGSGRLACRLLVL